GRVRILRQLPTRALSAAFGQVVWNRVCRAQYLRPQSRRLVCLPADECRVDGHREGMAFLPRCEFSEIAHVTSEPHDNAYRCDDHHHSHSTRTLVTPGLKSDVSHLVADF